MNHATRDSTPLQPVTVADMRRIGELISIGAAALNVPAEVFTELRQYQANKRSAQAALLRSHLGSIAVIGLLAVAIDELPPAERTDAERLLKKFRHDYRPYGLLGRLGSINKPPGSSPASIEIDFLIAWAAKAEARLGGYLDSRLSASPTNANALRAAFAKGWLGVSECALLWDYLWLLWRTLPAGDRDALGDPTAHISWID
jgi:hypothetical protein